MDIRLQSKQQEFLSSPADIVIGGGAAGGGNREYNMYMIKIYSLIDPDTDKVKYVGQTTQCLNHRLIDHISKAKRNKDETPKSIWIRRVLASGKRPTISLLETVDDKDKKRTEQKWIDYYDTTLNSAIAGAGGEYHARIDVEKYKKYFGVLSDAEIAEKIGVTRKAVSYHRRKLGIKASYNSSRMKPPPHNGGWNKTILEESIISLLGVEPDYILAKKAGISKKPIQRIRREMGIKSYAECTGNNGRFKQKI